MQKILLILLLFAAITARAQTNSVTGTITDSGGPLPGVTVKLDGTQVGTQTDVSGKFSIQAAPNAVLVVTYTGYTTQKITVSNQSTYNIVLVPEQTALTEVVVTALGISREKKSLGYASQQISGDAVNTTNNGNLGASLSGKIAGVQVRTNTGLGASSNIVIRGNKSLTGDNQALFVIDGVPVNNSTGTTGNNSYDMGNLASDLNPEDIESLNVLKGAAATALYGSRAANGAIIITTKKGNKKQGIGITVNSQITTGAVDKSTLPTYQTEYGAGYGAINNSTVNPFFNAQDIDGDGVLDLVAPYQQYGGFGARYDPNLLVYQWQAYYPESPLYKKKTPWVAATNGIETLFNKPLTLNNNIAIAGNNDKTTYRLSYTNLYQKGEIPNSSLKRHTFALNLTSNITKRLTATTSFNYTLANTYGRNERGSGSSFSNFIINMRQYWQPNIDFGAMREEYERTGKNITQFPTGTIDNPYYLIYNNGQSDERNRVIGNVALNYKVTSWLNILGRVTLDTYSYLMEERQNELIRVRARYTQRNTNFTETNYDLLLNYNKDIMKDLNISGVFGTNIRRNKQQSVYNTTNGGLIVPKLYAIANSISAPPPAAETLVRTGVDGYFGSLSVGYKGTYYLDMTGRIDQSSTLPKGGNSFFYPSIAGSFIFSNLIESDVLSFGKLRLNYAEVGNGARAQSLTDVLTKPTPFGSVQLYSVPNTKNNSALKPENTASLEAGLELSFFKKRLDFNVSVYKTNTKNQIMAVAVSSVTGYTNKFVNAGEVENRGLELSLSGKPIVFKDFTWQVDVNWAANRSKVLSLFDGVTNLQLSGVGTGNATLNAPIGMPYGTFFGPDFIYKDGQKVVNQTTGAYEKTSSANSVIGNMNPDWNGGVTNTVTYKKFSFKFLVDMQSGGDVYSEDYAVGTRNGLYPNTTGLNELGNPVRNTLANGGGLILPGVTPTGTPNTTRTAIVDRNHALGNPTAPAAMFLFDASYVKLREVALTYTLPAKFVQRYGVFGASVALTGNNLWIIHKNVPYADPEAGLGQGSLQGVQNGVFPSLRLYGFNLKLTF
jgi:TonB-linked SusC/RagA family outer membrane protein